MIAPFQFARLPRIIFGSGKLSMLPALAADYKGDVILVTGRNSFSGSVYFSRLMQDLADRDISVHHLSVTGEPTPEFVDEASSRFDDSTVKLVIAIGGGSAIDAGKAISAMAGKGTFVIEYLEGVGTLEHPGTKIPFIAVPTTSGTGSEATKNAVLSLVGKNGFKRSLRHDNLVPDIAIVDPELTLGCPTAITAASGMDCFTQLTEAFLSDKALPYTDALAIEGLKATKGSLLRSCSHGYDIEARTGMAFAALTSGICLANAGLGVVHGFASSVGAAYEIPHGVICGSLMAKANEVTVQKLRKTGGMASLAKYSLLGELFLDEKNKSSDYYIDGFIDYLTAVTEYLHLPHFGSYGMTESDIPSLCHETGNKNNPVKLDNEELEEILLSRL